MRGVDVKLPEYAVTDADEFELLDLRRWENCLRATRGVDEVYALAADMGGMGFISSHHAQILHNNILISTHTLEAARTNGVQRYLYTSSACVYPEYRQVETHVEPLREEHAFPAAPQDAYGWEKLVTERLCAHYRDDHGLERRTVRFHNIFGPLGTWMGDARRRRRRSAGRSRARSCRIFRRWRPGGTANRRARSGTSTSAWRASSG